MVSPGQGERLLERRVFEITRGLSGETGQAFFCSLVRLLAEEIPADLVLIGTLPSGSERLSVLAAHRDGAEAAAFEFDLAGTLAAATVSSQLKSVPFAAHQQFPADPLLATIGAESYIGCPILDVEGNCLGILAALTRAPFAEPAEAEAVLHIFAARAAAELQRQRYEEALLVSERRLREFTTHSTEGIARFDLNPPLPVRSGMTEDELVEYYYAHTRLADCNEQVAVLFGWPSREAVMGAPLEFLFPRPDPVTEQGLRAGIRADWKASEYIRILMGRCFLVTRSGIFREGHVHGAWITMRDITDLKEAQSEIRRLNSELEQRVEELTNLKSRLEQENAYLQEEVQEQHNPLEMIGSSPAFQRMEEQIRRAAPTSATVLLEGESGTGKELVARALHHLSARRGRPLVKINCAAIPAALVESELFGHVKGAFTGASERRVGRFEYAAGGTLFLDEVTELPLESQAKLLRVLQEQEFEPVGSNRTVKVDVRIIAATNRSMEAAVREGRFRLDLYYRLQVIPIRVPPLRERIEDVPALASHIVARLARQFGRRVTRISQESMHRMLAYTWPGNIRELENVLARAIALSKTEILEVPPLEPLPGTPELSAPRSHSLQDAERSHIEGVLRSSGWVLEGPRGAAAVLKINPSTLRSRMKRLGIQRPS